MKSYISREIIVKNKREVCPENIANGFNEYFVNVGTTLSNSVPSTNQDHTDYMPPPNANSMFLYPTDNNEVISIINSLKRKSPGYDGVTTEIVQLSHVNYINALTHIINQSLSQGVFPQELKIAKVIPIYKDGDVTLMSNYRPISVLSVFSKIFERIMYKRLMEFVKSCNLLYKYQFGFREQHGTDLALITLIDKISKALDEGDYVLGVFLDLSKAFDTVSHEILLSKLETYGIRGTAHKWLKSYLSHRNQFVMYNENQSNTLHIKSGVPQGSILGPLLFLLYVNDIANLSPTVMPILFADDTNLFVRGSNIAELFHSINSELETLVKWIHANKLSLNIAKTHYIVFRTRGREININMNVYIDHIKLKRVESTKFLGIMLDGKLNWLNHIIFVKNKIAKSIGVLCKARKYLNCETLITLYNCFVYPYLTYGLEVWGSASSCHIQIIEKIQKRAIRIITSSGARDHTAELFKSLNILPFKKVYQYCIAKLMFKFAKQIVPSAMRDMFSTNENTHSYNTRHRGNLRVPHGRTLLVHRTFRYMGVHIWNEISLSVDHQCSMSTYKHKVKKYLQEN